MTDVTDENLSERTRQLLEPGEIELNGVIVHTDLDGQQDVEMQQLTIDVGDVIAEHAGFDPTDTYVYSGNDSSEFASNQHQGLTLDEEAFVWECQQLLREGTFDVIFYYEASADHEAIVDDIAAMGHDVTGVEG
jgi:hypothetical protein